MSLGSHKGFIDTESTATKEKLKFIKVKNVYVLKDITHQNKKSAHRMEEIFLQIIYLIRDLYLEYVKNYCNVMMKMQITQLKMGEMSK
jgi:hypothetical protein